MVFTSETKLTIFQAAGKIYLHQSILMLTSRETDEMLNHRLVAFHVDLFIRLMEACIEGKIVQAQAHMNVRIYFCRFVK